MLELKNIKKDYLSGENTVHALKGINVTFRESEYVSVLGPSGCGKTTLLNIIGGLDRYTTGDIFINGVSTKKYKDKDWDTYRNHAIGFVFQSYNLIPHLTVLGNVEIALTISGISSHERKERATNVLTKVGLQDQIDKLPNQLSGGQMQRVAIARALINNPEVILADEPTGALDTETSIQVLNLLKEIAKDKLVIMVTHNEKLAQVYSNRIITMVDGTMLSDSNPILEKERKELEDNCASLLVLESQKKRPSMNFFTALSLSLKNLSTKKGRTIMTGFAGSIGIIGISLILAISSGLTNYMASITSDDMATSPITISQTSLDLDAAMNMYAQSTGLEQYPENTTGVLVYTPATMASFYVKNDFSEEFLTYISDIDTKLTQEVSYSYAVDMNVVYQKADTTYGKLSSSSAGWQEIISNESMVANQYDVLYGDGLPSSANELSICVDSYNRLSTTILSALGIDYEGKEEISYSEILNHEYKIILNNDYYVENASIYSARTDYEALYNSENAVTLSIKSILRNKASGSDAYLSSGLVYTKALTNYILEDSENSLIGQAQLANPTVDVKTGSIFTTTTTMAGVTTTAEEKYLTAIQKLGVSKVPTSISMYPTDYDSKEDIIEYISTWNTNHSDNETAQITYVDMSSLISSMLGTLINIISYVLIAFSAISLIVSSIMIGIITFVSVIERTKEIGVLRSIGASKGAIKRVFNAETLIIGFLAGGLGIGITYLLSIPINLIIEGLSGIGGIAALPLSNAVILIIVSMFLTFISGLIPASSAAKKDPVTALRTE